MSKKYQILHAKKCPKCKEATNGLWPLGEGVCSKCLVGNFTLEQIKKEVDSSYYTVLEILYCNAINSKF